MAAAAVALVVGVVGSLLLFDGDATDTVVADPTGEPAAEPSQPAEEQPPPPPPPPPPPGGPVDVEGVGLQLPPGWLLETPTRGLGCVTRTPGVCELAVVLPEVVRDEGNRAIEAPDPDSDDGWYLGTDVPGCEAGDAQGDLVLRELRPVDDRRAAYREWEVTCGGDPHSPARPRLWWLPKTSLGFLDQVDDAEADPVIDEIVRTADLSEVAAG